MRPGEAVQHRVGHAKFAADRAHDGVVVEIVSGVAELRDENAENQLD